MFLLLRATPRRAKGFSLIELVVVIAILGVLLAIAMPKFISITDDAKINQAKNSLATIIKECSVASLRGKSTLLKDISSAQANLSGFTLKVGGYTQSDPEYGNSDCYQSIRWPANSPRALGTQVYATPDDLVPGESYTKVPEFMIVYKPSTGETFKVCTYVEADGVSPLGCTPTVSNPFTGDVIGEW